MDTQEPTQDLTQVPTLPKRIRRRSLVEKHPKRKLIERDLLGGVKTIREISIEYNLTFSVIQQYRLRLFADVKRMQIEAEGEKRRERERLKARMDETYNLAIESARDAKADKKYAGEASLLAQAHQSMKLQGELAGVLGNAQEGSLGSGAGPGLSQINIANVIGLPKVGAGRIRPREVDGQVIDDTVEVETIEG